MKVSQHQAQEIYKYIVEKKQSLKCPEPGSSLYKEKSSESYSSDKKETSRYSLKFDILIFYDIAHKKL